MSEKNNNESGTKSQVRVGKDGRCWEFVPTPKDFRPFFSAAYTRQERMAGIDRSATK